MPIKVVFECSGCFKKADGVDFLHREFVSFSGRGYGFGTYRYTKVKDVTPDGWVGFDPYTGCCYCPDCWREINEPKELQQQSGTSQGEG